jgi:hypothetical protein
LPPPRARVAERVAARQALHQPRHRQTPGRALSESRRGHSGRPRPVRHARIAGISPVIHPLHACCTLATKPAARRPYGVGAKIDMSRFPAPFEGSAQFVLSMPTAPALNFRVGNFQPANFFRSGYFWRLMRVSGSSALILLQFFLPGGGAGGRPGMVEGGAISQAGLRERGGAAGSRRSSGLHLWAGHVGLHRSSAAAP